MTEYARKIKSQGIEPLRDNVIRILKRDMADEITLLAQDLATEHGETDPTPFKLPEPGDAAYLKAEVPNAPRPCVLVEPDEEDGDVSRDGSTVNQTQTLSITVLTRLSDDTEVVTNEAMRYRRVVFNILHAAERDDLFMGISNRSLCRVRIRGGRYRWSLVGQQWGRAVQGIKLIANYGETK